jgi:adenylate cyclase
MVLAWFRYGNILHTALLPQWEESVNKKTRVGSLLLIPLVAGGLFAFLGLLAMWKPLESRVYDLFLHLKPDVAESKSIVLLDVDEESIMRTASWPWPRGFMAKGLETLAELGAGYAVFDIEYNEHSPMSVDRDWLEGGLKSEFDTFFDETQSNVKSLFASLANGSMRLRDAADYGIQLNDLLAEGKAALFEKTERVAVENDGYLGKAMRLFGNAFVTLNLQKQRIEPALASRALAAGRFAYPRVMQVAPLRTTDVDFITPITEVSSMAAGAGFTNVTIDPDGTRRRLRLIEEIDGKSYLQLAFSPLIRLLGDPEIVYRGSSILLQGALYDGQRTDVTIPLDEDGNMLIRWPRKTYHESFAPHVSFYRLLEYRANEEALVVNLRRIQGHEVWPLLPGANPVDAPLAAWDAAETLRRAALESGKPEDRATWLATKADFRAKAAAFMAAGWGMQVPALIAEARDQAEAKDALLYDELAKRFTELYTNCSIAADLVAKEETALRGRLTGAYCVIGWTATATTDIGANPFDARYVNVGTHAAIANGILQRDFLVEVPRWVGAIECLVLALIVVLLASRFSTQGRILAGLGVTVLVFGASLALFYFEGIHVPVLAPTLATLVSFMAYALVSFIVESREKNFLRKAFSTYLSGDVINQIVADPSLLKLGGQKKWITAIFTDVKGFSGISEALDAEKLVKLLNLYLSGMSDIILENKGTIDKYEGDAIISFFGAPLPFEDHALAACRAAILMKRREAELNARFLAEGLSATPLLTRIGINTGDMVVGNMGTERKMDYTIMGNAVNLAARLEGVNKQYGTWVLAADDTIKAAGDAILARRLDRVRVVGISRPVELWELLDLRAEADAALLDFLSRFDAAHEAFDSRDWRKAAALFEALHKARPGDGPTRLYRERALKYREKPPAAGWDGVVTLTQK